MTRRNWSCVCGFVLMTLVWGAMAPNVSAETPLPGGFAIELLPGYAHEPLQGIDSIVGKIVKKDGLQIQFEIGRLPKEGGFRLGGDFSNYALRLPEKDRLWLKEQTAGGTKFYVAYGKDQRLIVSSTFANEGVNFSTTAKTPEEVADVLLMVLTLTKAQPKGDK